MMEDCVIKKLIKTILLHLRVGISPWAGWCPCTDCTSSAAVTINDDYNYKQYIASHEVTLHKHKESYYSKSSATHRLKS